MNSVVQSINDPTDGQPMPTTQEEYEEMMRSIKYTFPASFLDFKTVRTMCAVLSGCKRQVVCQEVAWTGQLR